MLRLPHILLVTVLTVGLVPNPALAEHDQDWFPAVISGRFGVVHGPDDSFLSAGGSIGYQAGRIFDGSGWFWSVGASAAYVQGYRPQNERACEGSGFLLGPEGRFGWAWGDWRRDVFLHLRFNPYYIQLSNEADQTLHGFGARMAIGVGYEQGLFKYLGTPSYGMPNLLELVVDFGGGGPFVPAARFGIMLGWEI
jgi:hypothetical protein